MQTKSTKDRLQTAGRLRRQATGIRSQAKAMYSAATTLATRGQRDLSNRVHAEAEKMIREARAKEREADQV